MAVGVFPLSCRTSLPDPFGQVAAANAVPEAQCSPDLLKKLGDEGEDKPEPTKL